LGSGHGLDDCFIAFPDHPRKPQGWQDRLSKNSWRLEAWNALKKTPKVAEKVRKIAAEKEWRTSLDVEGDADVHA
jgi:hypothetical protein